MLREIHIVGYSCLDIKDECMFPAWLSASYSRNYVDFSSNG